MPGGDELADRVGLQRRLVVLGRRRLLLVLARAVEADDPLGLGVVRLELVVGDRPVARLALDLAVGVVAQVGAAGVEARQAQVVGREAQRDAAVELRAAADDLGGVALDRRAVLAVGVAVDVRLVVEVGLDVAGVERRADVRHPRHRQALLGAGGEQLVALEVAQAVGRLLLGAQQRALLEHEHVVAGPHERLGQRRAAGAAADDHDRRGARQPR